MDANFETQKNLKALGITLGVCALLAMLLFLVSWTLPQEPVPQVEEGIEVNLGNSDQGMGDVAPAIPGEPSDEANTNDNPPPPSPAEAAAETPPVADNNDADATPVAAPIKPSEKPKPTKTETVKAPKKTPQKVTNPTPAPPKPKAVYAGGTSKNSGGNNADSYNGVRNQGIAGGNGDQGKPNGNPNSDSYTGNGGTGKSGVSIRSGLAGRRPVKFPSFEDDFNENAKVAVDITVAPNGTVTAARINPRGTTTTSSTIKGIAQRKALQLKFNTGPQEQTGTIVFDFKLKG